MWNKDDAIRLSQIRIKKGISARQMSNDLGLGENYINKIENLSSKPSLKILIEICKYLNVSLDELLGYRTVNSPELYEAINGLKDLEKEGGIICKKIPVRCKRIYGAKNLLYV